MRLIKIDKMSRLSSARERGRGKLKMLVNNEISRRVLDVTIDIQWWWLHNNIVLLLLIALLNGIVDTCTTGKQSRRKIVATCWEWMDFSWLSMREFSSLSSSDIFGSSFLTLLFAMGKSFFYSLRPSTLFLPPPILSLYRSRSLVFMFCLLCFTLSYKVSTYGIYLYKENSLDDFLRCDFMIMTLNSNQLNS